MSDKVIRPEFGQKPALTPYDELEKAIRERIAQTLSEHGFRKDIAARASELIAECALDKVRALDAISQFEVPSLDAMEREQINSHFRALKDQVLAHILTIADNVVHVMAKSDQLL